MNIKCALKGQYHAGPPCSGRPSKGAPKTSGSQEPTHGTPDASPITQSSTPTFTFKTSEQAFLQRDRHRDAVRLLWEDEQEGRLPPVEPPYSKAETLAYLDLVNAGVDSWVDELDLDSLETGFWWYKIPKLDHQLLNIRHLGGHTGQLSELVMATGADLHWVSVR